MSSKIRQLENGINLMIEGVLRDTDDQETIQLIVQTLHRTADDCENLDNDAVPVAGINVSLNVPRTPYNIITAIKSLAEEYDDLNGKSDPAFTSLVAELANN